MVIDLEIRMSKSSYGDELVATDRGQLSTSADEAIQRRWGDVQSFKLTLQD